jgi:hypothetical protein
VDIAKTTQMTRNGLDPYGLHTLEKTACLYLQSYKNQLLWAESILKNNFA